MRSIKKKSYLFYQHGVLVKLLYRNFIANLPTTHFWNKDYLKQFYFQAVHY